MKKTLYDVLGVSPKAGRDELKVAYTKIVSQIQPMSDQGDSEASMKLFSTRSAYEVLSNPEKRRAYDQRYLQSLAATPPEQADLKQARLSDSQGSKDSPGMAARETHWKTRLKILFNEPGFVLLATPLGWYLAIQITTEIFTRFLTNLGVFWLMLTIMIESGIAFVIMFNALARAKEDIRDGERKVFLKCLNSKNFRLTRLELSVDGKTGVAFDERGMLVCCLYKDGQKVVGHVYSPKDIVSSEVYEDGVVIQRTNRVSQVAGGLVGGVLLGGIGAVIGGLSGTKTSSDSVQNITLRIMVNNTSSPLCDVVFLKLKSAVSKQAQIYQDSMTKARRWHGIMEALIKQAGVEDKKPASSVAPAVDTAHPSFVADEILKLHQLRSTGILSQVEFDQQKARILEAQANFSAAQGPAN